MKITIEAEGNLKEEDMVLSDKELDNDNYIDMTIGGQSWTISLDEVFAALIAFDSKRSRRLSREENDI